MVTPIKYIYHMVQENISFNKPPHAIMMKLILLFFINHPILASFILDFYKEQQKKIKD